MRPLRTILVWTVALAAAGGWWSLRGDGGSGPVSGPKAIPLFDGAEAFRADDARSVRIERRGGTPITLTKEGNAWVQTAPFRAELDAYSARQLVGLAQGLAALRLAEPTATGDAAPAATLVIEGASGGADWKRTIEFLHRGVAGRAWIRVQGRIAVTDASLYERAVEMDPKEWRSRALFPESLGRIERIRRVSREGTIELARDGERWRMTSPIKTRADRGHVEELVAAIARARTDGFLLDTPGDLAPFGLDKPIRTLAVDYVGDAGPVTRSLLIGAPLGVGSDDSYAMIEGVPSVLRLSGATRDLLLPSDALLVDPTATGAKAADVKRLEIRSKDASFELVRSLDQWTAAPIDGGTAGTAVAANPGAVQALLDTLCTTRAPEMSFSGFPSELAVGTILLFGFDGAPLDIVRVARDPKTSRWGFDNGDGALRVHPAATPVPLEIGAFTH